MRSAKAFMLYLIAHLLVSVGFAQNVKMNNYTNTQYSKKVLFIGNNIWRVTNGGVVQISKSSDYQYTHTTTDGLAGNYIYDAIVDDKNKLWVATDGGVSAYNGKSWKSFTVDDGLPSNRCLSVFMQKNGNVWLATDKGVVVYDGNKLDSYTALTVKSNRTITGHFEDSNGTMWLATYDGVLEYTNKTWKKHSKYASSIDKAYFIGFKENADGALMVAWNYGVTVYDGNSWKEYHLGDIVYGQVLPYSGKVDILDDNRIFFQYSNGVVVFENYRWKKLSTTLDYYRQLIVDEDGNVWFSNQYGMYLYDGSSMQAFNDKNGLAINDAYRFNIDSAGNIVVPQKYALSIYDGQKWTVIDTANGMPLKYISEVRIAADGKYWLYAYNELAIYDGNSWEYHSEGDPLHGVYRNAWIDPSDGADWLASGESLIKYQDKILKIIDHETVLPIYGHSGVVVDNDNNKWFKNNYGVTRFINESVTTFEIEMNGDESHLYHIELDLNNKLWLGMSFGGFSYLDNDSVIDNAVTSYSDFDCFGYDLNNNLWSLHSNKIARYTGSDWETYDVEGLDWINLQAFAVDMNDNKWFGTSSGLVFYDNTEWKLFDESDGLSNKSITSIAFSPNGQMWCGTKNGVSVYNGQTWESFSKEDGLIDSVINKIVFDLEGKAWIATQNGLSTYYGKEWKNYQMKEGIAGNNIYDIAIDYDGVKWLVCNNGTTRFEDNGAGPYHIKYKQQNGYVFYDQNKNMTRDEGEVLLPKQSFFIQPENSIFNSINGELSFQRKDGDYTLTINPFENWEPTTPASIHFTIENGITETELIFGIAPKEDKPDLDIDLVGSATRAFFDTRYWLNVVNEGVGVDGVTVKMNYSPLLEYTSASVEPVSVTDTEIEWSLADLGTFDPKQIVIDFKVAGVENLGDTIINTVSVSSDIEDLNDANNTFLVEQIITGAYDPNDKKESKGIFDKGYTLFDEELFYTIRFQNTGTDTAFNIKIFDTLDIKLDLSTFRLESSSHSCTYKLDGEGGLIFTFKDIMLPDSIIDEPGSHGYVKYKITPQEGFEENTEVTNTAHIYFDFNPAIVTNTTINTFVSELPIVKPIVDGIDDQINIRLYPNPAIDYIHIQNEGNGFYYVVYTVTGNVVMKGISKDSYVELQGVNEGIYTIEVNGKRQMFVKK